MESLIFDWWWRSRQSLARKDLRIFRSCVMLWKDEREPTIKCCLGRQVDVVQKFITIQSFGHNWWWVNGFRVEYFPRIHIAALLQSPRVQEFLTKMSKQPEDFTGRIIFMSMFNDISWRSQDNEQECETNANFVSIHARRISPGRWSFIGPGSGKKWYSTQESKPRRERDRVEELMMLKFGESRHPVFRATSPLSRGVLKSKGGGKLSIHFSADEGTIETVFRTIISDLLKTLPHSVSQGDTLTRFFVICCCQIVYSW